MAADIEAAVAAHRDGRLDEAEAGYRAVLQGDPDNLRARYNLGLLLVRRRDFDQALPLLAEAVETAPPDFPAWTGYVQGLTAAGRFDDAERELRARGSGPQAEALEVKLRQAWAMDLHRRSEAAAAEAQLRRVCELRPDDPEAYADLGVAQLREVKPQAALASFDKALQMAPGLVGVLVNRGSALKALGRLGEAEAAYREGLAGAPGHPAAARNLNVLLIEQGRFEEALALADEGLKAGESPADLLLARGIALHSLGRFEDALGCFQAILPTGALRYEALTRVALAQTKLRRPQEALQTLGQAIAEDPTNPLAYYRRAFMHLLLKDFETGWKDYEKRLDVEEFLAGAGVITPEVRRKLTTDATPEQLAGKRVLLVAEQGIGDQVMFASVIPDLLAVASHVTCACDARLVRLFSSSFPSVEFLPVPGSSANVGDYDVVLAMGSLGRIWRNRLEDFPATPFLRPRAQVREAWAARLGPRPENLRIGLSWKGGSPRTGTVRRSLGLEQFAPVISLPGCQFVSLQYGEVEADVAAANAALGADVRVFPAAEIDDFEELAALVQSLDLVVSVQTALVHLCGAVGQECLTLVPHDPEWRYTLSGPSMPWYGSVRIFRQPEPGAWEPIIAEIADLLRGRLAA
ncbi:tetratricopeptide repeat protein [Phenylobacterium sp.]|jgi:tetratricopeptide (TPR) repeat protein|uniref:tetratricopeptide repeat protein n=1 Tax=Phenylobacterium sp. TaxID=1871053 RepID=UPI002F95DCDC